MSQPERPVHRPSHNIERRLAAILSADVKGYSRLMGADEEATLRTLTSHRQVMDALIAQHRGRIVGTAGDSVLAEFASVVEAVQCAVVIQTSLKADNTNLPLERQMEFRIGINLGDVMVEGEQIYGDGVNIAARLEALAEAGGICISGIVHEQVKTKLTLHYEDQGEQEVKNITEPVRTWRVVMDEAAAALAEQAVLRQVQHEREQAPVTLSQPRRVGTAHRSWAVVAVAGLLLLGSTIVIARYLSRPPLSTQSSALITQAEPTSALPLPDKPSIVVLPFSNMSGDSEQEYFSDGITEVLTSDLSKISSLFVIARNSAFTYKGKPIKVQDVGREMGVRYVLEGSVQKAGEQVRIVAQLIDATTGGHLWSERYDRPLKDLFTLQDEIVQKIVTTLQLQLTLWERGVLVRKTTDNLEAYDYWLRGLDLVFFHWSPAALAQARQLFEKAIEADPQYAEAYSILGTIYLWEWGNQWTADPQVAERGVELVQKALALDDANSEAHARLGYAYLWGKKQHEQAVAEVERALALNPNNADAYFLFGEILTFIGQPEKASEKMKIAMRLNPHYPPTYLLTLGRADMLMKQYEQAIAPFKQLAARSPNHLGAHVNLATLYTELDREAEARAEVAEILRISPNFSLEGFRKRIPYKDPAALDPQVAALRKAGLK